MRQWTTGGQHTARETAMTRNGRKMSVASTGYGRDDDDMCVHACVRACVRA